jgi:hypothetical protein
MGAVFILYRVQYIVYRYILLHPRTDFVLRDFTDLAGFVYLVVRLLDFQDAVKFMAENVAFAKKHLILGDTRFGSESETRRLPVPLPKNSGSSTN